MVVEVTIFHEVHIKNFSIITFSKDICIVERSDEDVMATNSKIMYAAG